MGTPFNQTHSDRSPMDGRLTTDDDARATELLTLTRENAELRLQLAETQDQCVELAIDAGELHVLVEALQTQLAHVEGQRDAWQAEALRLSGHSSRQRRG